MLCPVNLHSVANGVLILLDIIGMKNQRSNLDTLPSTFSLSPLIHERAMRRPPSPPIQLRIKTLDQHNLPRRLLPKIEPAMMQIRTNRKGLPNTIRINQLHRQKVMFGHGRSVRDSERVFADGLDGTPDVDDLIAAFEETLSVGGEVVLDALKAGFVGLVDVDALNGAAEGLGLVGRVGDGLVVGLAADGVVEDEDFGGAGAGRKWLVRSLGLPLEDGALKWLEYQRQCQKRKVTLRRLQNIFDFRVVIPLDFRLVLKCSFPTNMSVDLETRFVQGVLVLFTADVVHDHGPRLCWSLVGLWSANVGWCWRTAIARVFVVVELGDYIVGFTSFWSRLARSDLVVIA